MLRLNVPGRTGWVSPKLPLLTNAMSAYPYSAELEARFTFESAFDGTVCGALREGNTLWVPREAVPYAAPPNDFRAMWHPWPALDCTIQWRPEQKERSEQSLALLRQGRNHLFEAPTGWGKTVVGSWIAINFRQPTMIVVTKQDLLDQWKASLVMLGVPLSDIGHVQADVEDWKGKRVVLGMVQSLMQPDKYPAEMFKYFGLLLLDEVHQMAADCFVRVCQTFTAKARLGFSATPTRKDGKSKLLHWHIGPMLVKGTTLSMAPKVLVRSTGWIIPLSRRDGKPIPYAPGRMMLVNKAMASHDGRNLEIVNFTVQAWKAGRTVLILSDLREYHLHRLFQMLTNAGVSGEQIGYYVGGMSRQQLSLTKTCRIVLATYQMCSTGTDVPHWDTLVMATPRADVKQSVGRVLRQMAGKKEPVILDLVDKNQIFQSFHQARVKTYYQLGVTDVVQVRS